MAEMHRSVIDANAFPKNRCQEDKDQGVGVDSKDNYNKEEWS
jgi:hypothetical protein